MLTIVWFVAVPLAAKPLRPLSLTALQKAKTENCVLLHAWATWCNICVEEMPQLIKFLEKNKQLKPLIVDVSDPVVQKNFSKKWPVLLEASFATFYKPGVKDEIYLQAIDSQWDGALPYTALLHKGQLKEKWVGQVPLDKVLLSSSSKCR